MRRHRIRRIFLLCLFVLTIYSLYCFVFKTSVVDIRERSILRAKVEYQMIAENLSVNPEGQACRHPELDVENEALAQFLKKSKPIECESEPDWICIERGFAYVCSETLIKHQHLQCKFTLLKRDSDYQVSENGVVHANDKEKVQLKSDFFRVECNDQTGEKWENIMAGIHDNPDIRDRAGKGHLPSSGLGLNVLMWGHDSLSRMTFMRKLPKTFKYLKEKLGAIVLKGYNIVGDGTPQALIPILTGQTELELPETRKRMKSTAQFVNVYPLIWKDFQNNGYVTAFAEDTPQYGTFTYRLKGFDEQPTDHYMRTFFLAAEKEYSRHKEYCLRSTPRHKVAMNWIRHFFSMYSDKPKFAFSFLAEISHDDYNLVGSVDDDLQEMIHLLEVNNHLNNTLLIVMSDHGHRFAHIRETQQGKQEERLPFFAFVFPRWFEKKYPILIKNLRMNVDRLTTPFDIYPTLRNILHFEGTAMGDVTERGISLFKQVPLSRTCVDAKVEPHWCACLNWELVDNTDKFAQMAAKYLIRFINEITEIERGHCDVLKLNEIIWAGKYVPTKGLLQYKKNADYDGFVGDFTDQTRVSEELFQVKIRTQPGEGHFEASVKYNVISDSFSVKESDISRVNRYGAAAECVVDTQEQLRKFCHCKTKL